MLGEDDLLAEASERTAWEAYGACFHVRTLMGREIKVDAEMDETVAALKRKLEQQEGIPSVRMRLSYLDILLKDQCTLGFYEIEKTHPIQLVLTEPTDDFEELDGVEKIFKCIDVNDCDTIDVDELILFGELVGAYWSQWPPSACMELIGRSSGETATGAPILSYEPLSLEEFRTFCEAVDFRGLVGEAEYNLEDEGGGKLEAFLEAGRLRRDMLQECTRERLAAAFAAIDVDDSGAIDIEELTAFGLRVGAGWSRSACERLLQRMDADGNQLISLDEFVSFIGELGLHGCYAEVSAFIAEGSRRRAAAERLTDEQQAALFAAIDVDGSGAIDLDELVAFGRSIEAGWTREACAALLGRMDTDGDLAISPAEFRAFMSEAGLPWGLHGMHNEVNAFIVAGLLLRAQWREDVPPGEVLPPRHAAALRAQIDAKKREALALKRAHRTDEALSLYREVKTLERQASNHEAPTDVHKQRSAEKALIAAEAEILLADEAAARTEAATLAPAEHDDPELHAALGAVRLEGMSP